MRRRSGLLAGAAVFALALTTGCATSLDGLQFHNDKRLKITYPHENDLVSPPFTLHWTMRDFDVAGPGGGPVEDGTGYFAIFVDRSPVKPGQTLAKVSDDPSCAHTNLCTTKSYLAREQVFTTTKDELTLRSVTDILGNTESTQFHTATIVLMDTAGRRIGESAWTLEFKMHAAGADD